MVAHYQSERAVAGRAFEVAFFRGGVPSVGLLEACGSLPIRVSCNPSDLTRQDAERIVSAGCEIIEIEALSFDPYVLRSCRRRYTVGRVEGMIKALKAMGVSVGVHLSPGLPGGDEASAMESVSWLESQAEIDFVRVWPALGFEGADLAEWAKDGRWVPWDLPNTVRVLERMVDRLEAANLPVIRIGLQPGQDIPVPAVAGPYHPNLRGEVESRRFQARMLSALGQAEIEENPVVRVHPKDISWAKGTSNINARTLRTRLGLKDLRIEADPEVERGTVAVGAQG